MLQVNYKKSTCLLIISLMCGSALFSPQKANAEIPFVNSIASIDKQAIKGFTYGSMSIWLMYQYYLLYTESSDATMKSNFLGDLKHGAQLLIDGKLSEFKSHMNTMVRIYIRGRKRKLEDIETTTVLPDGRKEMVKGKRFVYGPVGLLGHVDLLGEVAKPILEKVETLLKLTPHIAISYLLYKNLQPTAIADKVLDLISA